MPTTKEWIRVCAWCKKILHKGKWVHIERQHPSDLERTTHGICPDCANTKIKR